MGDQSWPDRGRAEVPRDSPPPRRWPTGTVDDPMTAAQRYHYDRIVAAAGIAAQELPEAVRLVVSWLAAGDRTVCDGLVELVERVRDAGFEEASELSFYPFYGADEAVTFTVTVGELAERGLAGRAIGVGSRPVRLPRGRNRPVTAGRGPQPTRHRRGRPSPRLRPLPPQPTTMTTPTPRPCHTTRQGRGARPRWTSPTGRRIGVTTCAAPALTIDRTANETMAVTTG